MDFASLLRQPAPLLFPLACHTAVPVRLSLMPALCPPHACLRAVPVAPFQALPATPLLPPCIHMPVFSAALQWFCQVSTLHVSPAPWTLYSQVQLLLAGIDTSPKHNPYVLVLLLMPCLKVLLLAQLLPRAWALVLVLSLLLPPLLPPPAPACLSQSSTRFLVTG